MALRRGSLVGTDLDTGHSLDITLTDGDVGRVSRLDLKLDDSRSWRFAEDHAPDIDQLWAERSAANPNFFNGRILLMCSASIHDGVLAGRYLRTDFKSFLFWREQGFPAAGVKDAFGSAIVWSADRQLMFVKQRAGNVNSGLIYPPGGFVDPRDVRDDGQVDIAASVARELFEETGLGEEVVHQRPDFILTAHGAQLSIGSVFECVLPAAEMHAQIRAFLAADEDPELADVVFLSQHNLNAGHSFAPFAARLASELLAGARSDRFDR